MAFLGYSKNAYVLIFPVFAQGYKTEHFFLQLFSQESIRTHLQRQHCLTKGSWVSSYLLESLA